MTARVIAIFMILSLGITAVMSRATPPPERATATGCLADSAIADAASFDQEDHIEQSDVSGDSGPDAPVEDDLPETPEETWMPVFQQGVQDFSAGSARVVFNTRHLLRLPGLLELPGRYNHRLNGWIEWLMAQARLESTNMSVVAPPLQPHAPPTPF